MSTIKPRINVSVSKQTKEAIAKLAKRDQVADATLATRLIETALELEEDHVWDILAQERDKKSARFVPHDKAWK